MTLRIGKPNTRISKYKILILEHLIPWLIRKVSAEILVILVLYLLFYIFIYLLNYLLKIVLLERYFITNNNKLR